MTRLASHYPARTLATRKADVAAFVLFASIFALSAMGLWQSL